MISEKDIYISAQLLIKQFGHKAEEHVAKRMQQFLDKDDPQGAAVWLSISAAIEDLQNVEHPEKLH